MEVLIPLTLEKRLTNIDFDYPAESSPMNPAKLILSVCLAVPASAQGTFQNLDFESADLSNRDPVTGEFSVSQALPHWQVSENGVSATEIVLNSPSLNLWAVTLEDGNESGIPTISGKYSIFLQGGEGHGTFGYAEISQTGTIANDTHSVLFAARITRPGNLNLSFNGQPLQSALLQDHGTYQTFGADISAFSGQAGELSFTTPYPTWTLIDDIQFSSASIPEPSTLAMFALGCGVLLSVRRGPKARGEKGDSSCDFFGNAVHER